MSLSDKLTVRDLVTNLIEWSTKNRGTNEEHSYASVEDELGASKLYSATVLRGIQAPSVCVLHDLRHPASNQLTEYFSAAFSNAVDIILSHFPPSFKVFCLNINLPAALQSISLIDMSDEEFNFNFHHDGEESNELLRETAELFRWRVGANGQAERRPPNTLDYKTEWQHNARTPLGGLPTQMMMMMGNELGPVDKRHFLDTANIIRRNKDYIGDPGPNDESEAWFYTRRILRDAYNLAVQLEDAGKTFRDAVACSGCKETHPVEMFTKFELRMSPHFRNCKGRSGRFRVCDHVSLRWAELSARCKSPTETERLQRRRPLSRGRKLVVDSKHAVVGGGAARADALVASLLHNRVSQSDNPQKRWLARQDTSAVGGFADSVGSLDLSPSASYRFHSPVAFQAGVGTRAEPEK
ncbi:hypothetical protein BKA80DRAFT_255308 [Phyllosticta citrichinensis]